jgi:hypothetical protein
MFVRLALNVVMKNDGDFVDVITCTAQGLPSFTQSFPLTTGSVDVNFKLRPVAKLLSC